MITVAEYNHADQLQPFERLWNQLLDRTAEYCPSHTLEWINSQSKSEGVKLRILVAFLGGRPFGMLPLKVESRITPFGTLRCLTSMGEPGLPFAGPLGPNTTAMLAAAFRHVHRTRRDWDIVEFRLGEDAERLRQRLQNAFRLVGWSFDTSEQATNATRREFRYTHLSPWAIRARWIRFRERIQWDWRTLEPPPKTEPAPAPPLLTLYAP